MAPTTNMSLTLPVVSQTPGPEWASTINSDLSLIDAHDHTSAKGARIPSAALNINDNINFNSYSPYQVGYIGFNSQSGTLASNRQLYVNGGDLYYNNGSSTPVQITIGASVAGAAGTITGLPSGTASASFIAGTSTFSFASATNTQAYMDVGPIVLRKNAANSAAITIQPSGSIASNWTLTLPAAPPVSQSLLTIASSGTVSNATPNSTLTITSSQIRVATNGITTNELAGNSVTTAVIANAAVTKSKLSAANISASSAISSETTTSTSPVGIGALYCDLTTIGRPIVIQAVSTGASGGSSFRLSNPSGPPTGFLEIYLVSPAGTSVVAKYSLTVSDASAGADYIEYPSSTINHVMTSSVAGLNQFTARWYVQSGSTFTAYNMRLIAYEL